MTLTINDPDVELDQRRIDPYLSAIRLVLRARVQRRQKKRRNDQGVGNVRERRGRPDGHSAWPTTTCGGALCFGSHGALGLLNTLARHKLVSQFHLLRDFVNVLRLRATLSAANDLIEFKQFRLIVFSDPDI